jgi:hypothetical protein
VSICTVAGRRSRRRGRAWSRAGRLAAAGRQLAQHGVASPRAWARTSVEHARALGAAAGQPAGEQRRQADEDEQAEQERDEHTGAAHGRSSVNEPGL